MRKKSKKAPAKIVVHAPKRRGTPAPAEKIIPNPKKEEIRRKGRKKVLPEELEEA
ncbi:hypothetical protein HYR69_07515 [Candidatus Sumerlaeota bacterium]|nr:hypothetical protein [Candidatus Sumerlaeota bacterium]